MQPRRSLALVAGALLLCLPVLSSCGFDKATNRIYTPANGINYRKGDVYVLNAVIAAAQPGSGTLIASFTNQSETQGATLESVAGAEGNSVEGNDFAPVKIAPMGFVNLAEGGDITVTGDFGAGDVLPMSLNFTDGKTITMDVPVVYACQQYAGLDVSASSAAATGSASDSASDSATPSTSLTATPLAPTASPSASTGATNPEQPTPSPSDTGTAGTTVGSPSTDASTYVCGTSGGTGGRN